MKFMYTNPDGTIAIVCAAPKEDLEKVLGRMSDKEYRAHVLARSIPPEASDVKEISDSDLPDDRYFRDAWEPGDTSKIKINMVKARFIHMDRIRSARDGALKSLDVDTLMGADVQAEKQVLRDIPQTFDLTKAETPEELKALWPAELEATNGD